MKARTVFQWCHRRSATAVALLWLVQVSVFAGDWPQYRGPTTDGISTERIATTWATNSPGFVVWTNRSLSNGFSSFAVAGGRAFTLKSVEDGTGTGTYNQFCVAVDAATGTNLWATYIDSTPWDASVNYNGGEGKSPCDRGDGPRSMPAVKDGQVFVLSAADASTFMLVCLNATNGSVLWSNNLASAYGAGLDLVAWEGGASPRLDGDLIFVNCNSATSSLLALRTGDGSLAWRSPQNERMTHSTPTVATIAGSRQVVFATQSGLVALHRDTGNRLWKYTYPFTYGTALGAAPVLYSNIAFVTMGYGKGAAAARITVTNGVWTVAQLWAKGSQSGISYNSTWMTPVCHQGFLYGLFGDKTFTNSPLVCLELATGNLKWATNNFGMGGLLLVNTNLLVATEDGALVLAQPNTNAYTQLARYQAFRFSSSLHGKCWNSPAYSNGRIYVRSTTGGLAVDVSVPPVWPDLATIGASNITDTAATLHGSVEAHGVATQAWFQWGLTTSYGSNTPATTNLTGTGPVSVTHLLSGLATNRTYHFRLVASNSAGTTNGADLAFTTLAVTLPQIATQPRSRAAVEGGSAVFLVGVSNPPTNSYQWLFPGTNPLAGQTNATLSIASVRATNFGDYRVRVSNSYGAVTSAVALLTRAVAPGISASTMNRNTFFLTFPSEFGPTYYVDYKHDLNTPGWLNFTSVAGDGNPVTLSDSGVTNVARFYRVRVQ
jgi:outer membrane protein assembly factor BamB